MSLVESFSSARQRRQLALAAGLAVLVCGVLIVAYFTVFHSAYDVLFNNLRPADAATIVGELDKKKIPYRLKDGGATILVPSNVLDATRLSVVNADLPLKGAVGFELFNKSDIGLTEFAQKINYQRALQGELARTIMTMDAVDSARVHLSLPDQTIFKEDRRPPKASVTVLPRAGKIITPDAVSGIQHLVAAAVPDLEIANVVVLDDHGDVVSHDLRQASNTTVASDAAASADSEPSLAAAPVKPASAKPAPAFPDTPVKPAARGSGLWLGAGGGLVVLLMAALALWSSRTRNSVKALTTQERDRYARRLKTLLEREGVHVPNA